MYELWVMMLVALASASGRSTAPEKPRALEEPFPPPSTYMGGLGFIYKIYQECAEADLNTCLKLKFLTAMDRVNRAYPQVKITDAVVFVRSDDTSNEPLISEADIEAKLPMSIEEKNQALNSMIAEEINEFFKTHTLQVKLPTAEGLQRSFVEEGRKKKKGEKGDQHMYMIPLVLGGFMLPLAIASIAVFAGKSLLVSVLALVLSSIVGIRNMVGGHHKTHRSDQVHKVVVASGADNYNARYMEKEEAAQDLAYSGYIPKNR